MFSPLVQLNLLAPCFSTQNILMAYCLLCLTSSILSLISISSGDIYQNMCQNISRSFNDDTLELDALESSISGLTGGFSMTCSCSFRITPSSNKVYVYFSRVIRRASGCENDNSVDATLNYTSGTRALQDRDLSGYKFYTYNDVSYMSLDITVYSKCGSNYTINIWLTESSFSNDDVKFSNVTCRISKTVFASVTTTSSTARRPVANSSTVLKFTTASRTTFRPTNTIKNDMSSTNSSKESNNADSVVEKDTSATSRKGLIAGVVVGVGGGLFILGAAILVVFIYRRRRAKPQPLTYANNNAPTESSYESLAANVPIFYEDLRSSNEFPPSSTYDNQTATTDSLTTETNRNYYSVQGIDNSALHPSDAASNSDRASSEGADSFSQEPHSENDTETTVIENDLYEK